MDYYRGKKKLFFFGPLAGLGTLCVGVGGGVPWFEERNNGIKKDGVRGWRDCSLEALRRPREKKNFVGVA